MSTRKTRTPTEIPIDDELDLRVAGRWPHGDRTDRLAALLTRFAVLDWAMLREPDSPLNDEGRAFRRDRARWRIAHARELEASR